MKHILLLIALAGLASSAGAADLSGVRRTEIAPARVREAGTRPRLAPIVREFAPPAPKMAPSLRQFKTTAIA